ncbi:uncharacterized protein A1O9_11957 [Exophiala aquamarina CBS 119918]|uniref:Major facilitator superfamily (MFS) profile domain-containing protein n=1 Tax=Exophiala aquamarina CBS 119918 TaxID=1182545 RepID=A0A072NX16_9EURO|nr:uncharacterized protein A1O9_11957 [Exophiala aquamarina CBS 119918]KEF51967.1 hypothetical protein A1O9_11957 [Exophiala aquamarina CBS 119918]
MKFRTLRELGHTEQEVTLIDSPATQDEHNPRLIGTDIVLVPHPSNDINDPLRLPQWKKWAAFLNICMLTFMTCFWLGGLSPAFYLLSLEFNVTMADASGLLVWPVLSAGLCNFFWVPFAEYLGRRPVFLVGSLGLFVCEVWSATSASFNSLLASRVVGAFMGSCTEAMGALIVNDLFFLHERGSKMGVYIIALYFGNSMGPLITGFIVQGESNATSPCVGWRWASWVSAILGGINFLGIVLFVPESRYTRSIDAVDLNNQSSRLDEHSEKPSGEQLVQQISAIGPEILIGDKKTWIQEMNPWSGTSNKGIINHFIRPFPLLAYPAVAWAALTYSVALAWLVGAGTLSSFIFQVPPYNFSAGVNGLIGLPGLTIEILTQFLSVGNFAGAIFGGKLTDVYARRRARRSGGKFVPESRLVLLIIPAILGPCGLLMFGFGAQKSLHWAVLYVGYGLISIVPAAASIAMTYVMDSYFEVAAEGLLVVNGIKNVAAYGFTYGFIPWTTSVGYETVNPAPHFEFFQGPKQLTPAVGLWDYGRHLDIYTAPSSSILYLGRKHQKIHQLAF